MATVVVLYLVVAVACGFLTANIADSKGRAVGSWFVVGLFFGPLGLLGAGLMERESVAFKERRLQKLRQGSIDVPLEHQAPKIKRRLHERRAPRAKRRRQLSPYEQEREPELSAPLPKVTKLLPTQNGQESHTPSSLSPRLGSAHPVLNAVPRDGDIFSA